MPRQRLPLELCHPLVPFSSSPTGPKVGPSLISRKDGRGSYKTSLTIDLRCSSVILMSLVANLFGFSELEGRLRLESWSNLTFVALELKNDPIECSSGKSRRKGPAKAGMHPHMMPTDISTALTNISNIDEKCQLLWLTLRSGYRKASKSRQIAD